MVIQRLQNLYLLIASVLMSIFCFSPFMEISIDGVAKYCVSAAGVKTITTDAFAMDYNWATLIVSVLAVIITVITIFRYKKLKNQKKMCAVCIMLTFTAYLSSIIAGLMMFTYINDSGHGYIGITLSAFLPLLAFVFTLLARRGIVNDLKLLSSADRIR